MSRSNHGCCGAVSDPSQKPVFVGDQDWSVLVGAGDPLQYLKAEQLRANANLGEGWAPFDSRDDLIFNRWAGGDLSRVFLTTDAGLGKSCVMDWLTARWNTSDAACFAFQFKLSHDDHRVSSADLTSGLLEMLAEHWSTQTGGLLTRKRARGLLVSLLREGRLVLLFDELDHIPAPPPELLHVLSSPDWRRCRIVVAGRVHAVHDHWKRLQRLGRWRFLTVHDFSDEQQQQYLGAERWKAVPPDARPILSIPRVLSYLHGRSVSYLRTLESAARVYYDAIDTMLMEGLNASGARAMGGESGVPRGAVDKRALRAAWGLLAAMAYQTLRFRTDQTRAITDWPNFPPPPIYKEHITRGEYDAFEPGLEQRCLKIKVPGDFRENLNALSYVNDVVRKGLLEAPGFDQVKFANRSLQEFLAAYYLAKYADREDADAMWDRIYIRDQQATDAYYQVWQFLSEMPEDALDPPAWLEAIEPLYRPTQTTDDGKRYARRSTEMIFRSWGRLRQYCRDDLYRERAREILDRWRNEFAGILDGHQGNPRREAAQSVADDFLSLPSTDAFRMGAPAAKQGAPEAGVRGIENILADVDGWLSGRTFHARPTSDRRIRAEWRERFERARDTGDRAPVLDFHFPKDETPESGEAVRSMEAFQLARGPVRNAQIRLFDPGFGLRTNCEFDRYNQKYAEISPSESHPAVFVSWFDAWVLGQWFFWEDQACALPTEEQWEYAASTVARGRIGTGGAIRSTPRTRRSGTCWCAAKRPTVSRRACRTRRGRAPKRERSIRLSRA